MRLLFAGRAPEKLCCDRHRIPCCPSSKRGFTLRVVPLGLSSAAAVWRGLLVFFRTPFRHYFMEGVPLGRTVDRGSSWIFCMLF